MHIRNIIQVHPFVPKILRKNIFLHQSRAITLLFINQFNIPNHSSLISMSMQSLKKIGQKIFFRVWKPQFYINQGPLLCGLDTNLAHLPSQTTPP